jgi:hypothetical protein
MHNAVTTGWTGPIDDLLVADSTPIDLTGLTVELVLVDRFGVAVDTSGKTQILNPATAGKVRFNPGANDLSHTRSPYANHWKVTDAGGKVVFFPNDKADRLDVFTQG